MPDYVYAVDLDYTSTLSITTECQPQDDGPEMSEDMDTALEQDPEPDKDEDSDADEFDLV